MADLGPAIAAIVGTSIGGLIAAGAGLAQSKSQERVEERRLEHELQRADAERKAVADSDRVERERKVLLEIMDLAAVVAGRGATYEQVTRLRGLTFQADDAVLRGMVEHDQWYRGDEFLARVGYLLRTPDPDDREHDWAAHRDG